MHRLFLKIFFGMADAWGVIAIVLLGGRLTGMRQVSAPNMYGDGCAYPGGRSR